MTRALLVLPLLMLLAGPVAAQEPAPAEADKNAIPADFTDFIKRINPRLDPAGEHDFFRLKNPDKADARHAYTDSMARLLQIYLERLDLGSTLSKLFDQYSRGKEASYPTFKVLYALLLVQYPPGQTNMQEGTKLLREAATMAPDYAHPWYYLGEIESARLRAVQGTSPKAAIEATDKALALRPDFLIARMLRAELHLGVRPPQVAEALALVEPMVADASLGSEEITQALDLYGRATSDDKLLAKCETLLALPGLDTDRRAAIRGLGAATLRMAKQTDKAIQWMEAAMKDAEAGLDPQPAIRAHRFLAECWGIKAIDLRREDPNLTGDKNRLFDEYVEAARREHQTCADLEAKRMPVSLRGGEAAAYLHFMVQGLEDYQGALEWLDKYLKETDLPAARRTSLEGVARTLRQRINPVEDEQVKQLEDLLARDAVDELVNALVGARQNVLRGVRFKSEAAQNFFVSALDNRDRRVVLHAAALAADTALNRDAEARAKAALAVADRLAREIECNTTEQSELQQELLHALVRMDDRPALARAVKHLRTLVDGATASRISLELDRVAAVIADDDFLKKVKDAPEKLSSLQRRSKDKLSPWLEALAKALEAPAGGGGSDG
ncbi:MAG: hypothetical protein IT463_05325 [Planctomycetes bacterium]|nr:hypothetical protein [Planctomycetota bacterium]